MAVPEDVTASEPARAALQDMERLYKRLLHRRTFVREMEDAYLGSHRLFYASDEWSAFCAGRYRNFSDNWCAPVANAPAERAKVLGFRLSDSPERDPAEMVLWKDWEANELDVQSSQGFLQSVIAASSGVLVWGDADENPLATWEHPAETIVDYDPENRRAARAFLKVWHDDDTEYATYYTPDEVYKWQRPYESPQPVRYTENLPPVAREFFSLPGSVSIEISNAGNWTARQPSSDDSWPLVNPLSEVPFVEFPNRPMLGNDPISEIQGVLAMQRAINLLWMYAFNAADFASMPARVVMGQDPPKMPILDSNGIVTGHVPVDQEALKNGRMLWLTGENTKIGQWSAADLEPFTKIVETGVAHIAAQTRTPPHYLILGQGMVNISADGMRAAEAGLVAKVSEMHTVWTPSVRKVFRLMAKVRGDLDVADQCRHGAVQWKNAANRSEAQLVDQLLKLQILGFPFAWLAEQYGLTEVELQRVLDMKSVEAEADPIGVLSQQLGQQTPATVQANNEIKNVSAVERLASSGG